MTDPVQKRLDDIYAGRVKLKTGAARTRELAGMLSREGRIAVAKGLSMCPWARREHL